LRAFALACALACLGLCHSPLIYAARPLVTDDAHILDPRSCQLEVFYQREMNAHLYGAAPSCNPFGSFELMIGTQRTVEEGERTDVVAVQVKTLFRPALPNDWGVGIAFGAQDQTAPGRSPRFGEIYANVLFTASFRDDRLQFHGNAGADRNRYDDATRFTWGAASEAAITERITLIAETFRSGDGRPSWQAGARFAAVPARVEINGAFGRDWRGASHWWTFGVRFNTPALW
jgi:hypothetical protein